MIAAVARARMPGIKFDDIRCWNPTKAFNKSTAWRVLAGDENFSDEKIIGKEGREVQEQLAEIWIHENADLRRNEEGRSRNGQGVSRLGESRHCATGVWSLRQEARPRHSIEVGTTNADTYLQSQTGNRRFWPLRGAEDHRHREAARDRLQLWGEAAHYQSKGESLVLDDRLWTAAAGEQEQRRVTDPWEDILRNMPAMSAYRYFSNGISHEGVRTIIYHERDEEKVVASHLLQYVLGIQPGDQTTQHTMRLSLVMKKLGWNRNTNGYLSITNIGRVKGYYRTRGERPE